MAGRAKVRPTWFHLIEGETEKVRIPFTHADGTNIALGSVASLRITLREPESGDIVNERDAQSLLNTNNGTYADGVLVWAVQPEDTEILNEVGAAEDHYASITLVTNATPAERNTARVVLSITPAGVFEQD